MTADRDQLVMEDVFRRRARQLAERRTVSTQTATRAALVFALGSERFAIEISELAEVLPYRGCTPVPGAPIFLRGVLNVRGDIRPVIDLRSLLGVEAVESTGPGYLLMLRHESGAIGLTVDALAGVRHLDVNEFVSIEDRRTALRGSSWVKALTADTVMVIDTRAALSHAGVALS